MGLVGFGLGVQGLGVFKGFRVWGFRVLGFRGLTLLPSEQQSSQYLGRFCSSLLVRLGIRGLRASTSGKKVLTLVWAFFASFKGPSGEPKGYVVGT